MRAFVQPGFEVSQARLTRVARDERLDDLPWERQVPGREAVFLALAWDEVLPCDVDLLVERVARQFEDFLEREIDSARSAGMLEPVPLEVPNPNAPQWDLVPAREPWHIGSASLDPVPQQDWAEAGITRAPRWGGPHTLALWWADGKRTIRQIYENVAAETDPAGCDLIAWFRLLEKHGYVTLQPAQ